MDRETIRRDGLYLRPPLPALRPFIRLLWASRPRSAPGGRERVLPTGTAHLAIRTLDEPVSLYAGEDEREGRSVASAVLGGPRSGAYIKEVSTRCGSVGAQFEAGGLSCLAGEDASVFAQRHLPLADVWGGEADRLAEQVREEPNPDQQLDRLESFLLSLLPRRPGADPLVARAVARLERSWPVSAVVAESGYSHRHLLTLFTRRVGLTPKVYSRVVRVRRAVHQLASGVPAIDAAGASGFADQAHLGRELRRIAGLSPGEYVRRAPVWESHVPVGDPGRAPGKAVQFRSRQPAASRQRMAP